MKINPTFSQLTPSYLFAEIANRVAAYKKANPGKKVISLGIGDVTRPLIKPAVDALIKASGEMGTAEGFRGYGPEQGYEFLRAALVKYYAGRGVTLATDEVFVSDGAKSDLGNFLDIFPRGITALIPDPVYPAYVDGNIMSGNKIVYMNATPENGFLPMPDDVEGRADVIYLCSPNNPTGAAYTFEQLAVWVDYALKTGALIIYDAAYERFIQDEDCPHTVFSVPGARGCAVEICSFSKMAGFTGLRCGWTVVPHELQANSVNAAWLRRQCVKFNGVPYIVQRAAEATLTPEGLAAADKNIEYYRINARVIGAALDSMGIRYYGGKNSPYIWMQCGMPSWEYFDKLLNNAQLVGTPGAGFGKNGEGFFRLTAFGGAGNTVEAAQRLLRLTAE